MAKGSGGGVIGASVGGVMPPKQSSAPNGFAIGSGSRPGGSKFSTPTSAPVNPKTLGRDPGGSLK